MSQVEKITIFWKILKIVFKNIENTEKYSIHKWSDGKTSQSLVILIPKYFPLYNFYLYYQLSFCLCQPSLRKFAYPSSNKNCTVLTFSTSLPISQPLLLLLPPPTPSQQSFLQLMDGSLILSHHPVLQRLHLVMILMLCLNFPKLSTSLYSITYFQANNKYFYMAILLSTQNFHCLNYTPPTWQNLDPQC